MTHKSENLELKRGLDVVYMSIDEAREEIWKRWNNKELKTKVQDFLGGSVPEVFKDFPRAVIGRQILSPNFEMISFLESAKSIDLSPICFGYLDDKLVTKNLDKYYLCKLFFEDGVGKHGGERVFLRKVLDFNKFNGASFREAKTNFGLDFVEFHKTLANRSGLDVDFFDGSEFLHKHGAISERYYKYFLSLFVCHGVLFENYLLEDEYGKLTVDIFSPNYSAVNEIFGVKPIIVRLVDAELENDLHWRRYPISVSIEVDKIIQNGD